MYLFFFPVPPHIHDDGQKDFTAVQGLSIKLPCKVTGDPKPLISWTKNGVRITESDPHYFLSGDGSLEIFSADPQDTATYSCTAINIAGLKEKRMTLFVQSKFHITSTLCRLNPMVGRPGLPGHAVESSAATTVAANGGLWTLGFKHIRNKI